MLLAEGPPGGPVVMEVRWREVKSPRGQPLMVRGECVVRREKVGGGVFYVLEGWSK